MNIQELFNEDNIANVLDEDTLLKIGDDIITGFDDDKQSRSNWETEMKDAMDLALQIMEDKTYPWPGASNVKMPLLTEAAIQYNSRMYPALISDKDLVKARVIGADSEGLKNKQGTRVSKHMSFQMLEEMEEWEEEMDIGFMVQPILGNMYKKTYFDGRNYSDMISPAEFVINNNAKNLETAYRKSHILYKNQNQFRTEVLLKNYRDIKLGEPEQKTDETKTEGTHPKSDKSTNYKLIEQHTYWDLDNDGLEEPYIITVEYDTRQVVRIEPCFDLEDVLFNGEDVAYIPQIQYFTKYGFIPNPDGGIMDLGLGKLLGPTNHSVNTLINQLIDAGTKANMGGGFLGRGVRMKGGALRFSMGEFKRIDSTGDDIRKNLISLPTPEPSNVLFSLLGLLINAGQRLASTLDSQIGEDPGQNQKATTTVAVQEQGQKIFNGIYKRNLRSLNKEIKKLFYLNSVHLPEEDYLNILDEDPKVIEQVGTEISKFDYDKESLNIIASADKSYATQQMKMAKSQALWEKAQTGLVNPKMAMKTMLEAEEQPNIEALMDVPPPQPSLDQLEFEHQKQIDWFDRELEVIKSMQEDLRTQSDAVYKLAQAEAAEEGTQINQYRAQVEQIKAQSAELGKRAAAVKQTAGGGNQGMEAT